MTDGAENRTYQVTCRHTKQKFGKPHLTSDHIACQTLASLQLQDKDYFWTFQPSIKFIPP
ncbi:hypothetical protein CEN47_15435 [Fischerella thermalis CCMEE 5319]|nr:hypothetical protein CEN47_15435 [Fischerella thermalis CCMEE 5319]